MKRIILSITLCCSVYLSAQTVIDYEKFNEANIPFDFKYLPKTQIFLLSKGDKNSSDDSILVTNILSFDSNGKKSVYLDNLKVFGCSFSMTENSFRSIDPEKKGSKPSYSFFLNNYSQVVNKDILENINYSYFGTYNYNNVLVASPRIGTRDFRGAFNDSYVYGFTNQKESWRVNFEKEDIYLETIEIKSSLKKRFKLEKPDLSLLKGDSFAKSDFDLNFTCKLNGNNDFDLITKSLSKDFQTTILYKTTYDFEGKKLKVVPFKLTLDNKFFIASNNGGGPEDFKSSPGATGSGFTSDYVSLDVLSINNYFEDIINGDIYIYGIFSDKLPNKIQNNSYVKGFYVFKFDKDGNKLWESVNDIDTKDYLEKIRFGGRLKVSLLEYNKDLIFSVSVNDFTEFTNSAIINKETGSVLKTAFIEYNNNLSHEKTRAFISNTYDYKELKNKTFSQISFAAISVNSKVMNYLKGITDSGKRLYFETIFSDQGIWLIETDNKEYYKILLFKD